MPGDPLFDAEMPLWWQKSALVIRGFAIGFLIGHLFTVVLAPAEVVQSILVVLACCFVAALPGVPKAWIEQRNRNRAAADGTLESEIAKRQGRD